MLLFGLGNLIYVSVLFINAIAILSEDRFLARIGWGTPSTSEPAFGQSRDERSMKSQMVNLITSTRTLLRIPMIIVNTLIIVYELILG